MGQAGRTSPAFWFIEGLGLFFVLIVGHAVLEQPYRRHLHLPLRQALTRLPDWHALRSFTANLTASAADDGHRAGETDNPGALEPHFAAVAPPHTHTPRLGEQSTQEPCRSVPTEPPLIKFIGGDSADDVHPARQ